MSKITILGAGLAGLSCAYHLRQDYNIYEKETDIGGLCKSKKVNGFIFDYDGHLLHFKDSYTKKLIHDLLHGKLIQHKRKAYVFSHNTYTEYPFQAKLYGLPLPVIEECLEGLIKTKSSSTSDNINFRQWILSNFGEGIAKHFMLPYNRKFWTVPLETLTTEWIDGFIPVPSLKQILNGSLQVNKKEFGYNINFWYPSTGGIETVSYAFSKKIKSIHTSKEVKKIDVNRQEIQFQDGQRFKYNKIVSTIPLPELASIIVPLPSEVKKGFKELKFTSIYVLNLGVKRKKILDAHWIYFPSQKFPFYRIGFPYNFSSKLTPNNCSSIYVEVAYSKHHSINKRNIKDKIIEKLIQLEIIHSKDEIIIFYPMDIKYGYVIYDKNYKNARDTILQFLKNNNIFSIGRYGSWEYKSMEDVVLDGKEVAEKLNSN